jgi:uncharacterized integral membrane protein (TIGR00698 family)
MIARLVLIRTPLFPKVIPGILLAPYLFVPIGIILYGHQLRFDEMRLIHPITFVWMLLVMAVSYSLIFFVGRRLFKFSTPFANLLAAGSAVCGASAMAVISPIVEAEPDELGAGLISNTLLVIASLLSLQAIASAVSPQLFASVSGAVLQQTGFVHMAVDKGPLQDFAILLKTTRVALLIIIVPIIYYSLHRRFFFPWYMILFVVMGIISSSGNIPPSAVDGLKLAYGLIFTSALASIGLNANIMTVGKRLFQPLLLTYIVFIIAAALFLGGESLLH